MGVLVNNLGSDKGVQTEERGVGYVWVGPFRNLYLFPTFTQNYTYTLSPTEGHPVDESISFQSKEGMSVNTDIGITYHVDPAKATLLFQTYRRGIEEITDIYIRNMIRNALVDNASQLPIDDIYGAGKVQLIKAVESQVREQLAPKGIVVENVYWIGKARLPEAIESALNAKMAAMQNAQMVENQIAAATAEAKKTVATAEGAAASRVATARGEAQAITVQAEAQAKANDLIAKSLTPELVRYKSIEKWSGAVPNITSGVVPFMDFSNQATQGK